MKGFRDFYPDDWRVLKYIFDKWREISIKYGYDEIEGPILEESELYIKSGQELPEQMFTFVDNEMADILLQSIENYSEKCAENEPVRAFQLNVEKFV